MKKIRDFFYNVNDLVVALLILCVAVGLIYWRFNVIMDYPSTIAKEVSSEETATTTEDIEPADSDTGDTDKEDDGKDQEKDDKEQTAAADVWKDGKLTKKITVNIPQMTDKISFTDIFDPLISAGIYKSYEDYEKVCKDKGYNPLAIRYGEYTFDKGMTKEQVTKKLTWS